MPTYDYVCSACRHRFERFEAIGDDAPKRCPQCGKKRARRMLSTGAGIIFKGSGFYTTDYKKGPAPADPPSDGSTEKTSDSEKKKPGRKDKKEEPKK